MNIKSQSMITMAVLSSLVAALDLFGLIAFPTGILSVSGFYIGSAFYVLIVAEFGSIGALSIYFGLIMSSFFTGFSLFPLYGALGNTFSAIFIVTGFNFLSVNLSKLKLRDIILFSILYIISPAISGLWVITGWVYVKILPKEAFFPAFFSWWLGGVLVYFVVATPLLKFCLPALKRFNLRS